MTNGVETSDDVALPFTLRSDLAVARLDPVLIQMIEDHAGRPCPTRKEVMEWTGLPRRWADAGKALLDHAHEGELQRMLMVGRELCCEPRVRQRAGFKGVLDTWISC